jgi:hypothetical protein
VSRALIVLRIAADRTRAIQWIEKAPWGTRIEFKASKRSLEQNARFWAMLTDVATQLEWHGKKLKPDDWKLIFLDGLKRELRLAPNLEGNGFVNLGRSSSDLTKDEMGELMELIAAFGANHGVKFQDDERNPP